MLKWLPIFYDPSKGLVSPNNTSFSKTRFRLKYELTGKNVNHWKELLKENMIHTIRILAANASNRSIRPESGSPTALAILIASSAWRQPMIPGTEN